MGGFLGIAVLFLLGVDSCAAGGGGSPIGGGGGGGFEPPEEDTADTGENGGTPGPLADCDPEYDAVWVQCNGGSTWIAHAEMNVAVTWLEVAFAGTDKGDVISETAVDGVFEGELRYVKTPCDQPNGFDFRAYGTLLSTYECSYDYTP
jgi:hypothetical protein